MIRECQLPPVQMKKHIEEQIKTAGLNNDNPYLEEWGAEVRETSSEIEQNVDSLMKHVSGTSKFVMFTTKAKLDPIHGLMKRLEAQYKIVTQHVSSQTLNKAIGQKGAFMVLGNLCLKLNLKLGGVNHCLKICDQYAAANPNLRNV
ncbi:hypothetical protein TELCIR_07768 [Teladorsagia circumcincta]|uniref:Uncharacterized protein n=1 Tax=Teladorsagia circumcincta TaxID=45464 RepID=A0A2G9UJG2_TELCI|nr:hypothetical protein TELCIR_07768 [Teladorsagia circumcincta]